MILMIVCGVLLAMGVALAIIWGGERMHVPEYPVPTPDDDRASTPRRPRLAGLRYYIWWVGVFIITATATGILVTGAGGRLAMRLLAATSPEATGLITEAGEVVGDITIEGTIAYLIFGALPAAFISAVLYLFVAPWLPGGRLAGPAFGVVLLVAIAPFIDPLRSDNFDFDRLGPGWLSILVFAALAVVQGALLAAVAGRVSRSLPLMSRQNLAVTATPLLPAVVLLPIGVVLAAGALAALAFPRLLPWILVVRASRSGVITGRILLAVAVLVALPAFIAAVLSIWGR